MRSPVPSSSPPPPSPAAKAQTQELANARAQLFQDKENTSPVTGLFHSLLVYIHNSGCVVYINARRSKGMATVPIHYGNHQAHIRPHQCRLQQRQSSGADPSTGLVVDNPLDALLKWLLCAGYIHHQRHVHLCCGRRHSPQTALISLCLIIVLQSNTWPSGARPKESLACGLQEQV